MESGPMTHPVRASRRLHAFLFLGFLVLAACDKGNDGSAATGESSTTPAGSAHSAGDDLAALGEYRLSMDKFDKYVAAQRNMIRNASKLSPAEKAAMEARSDSRDDSNASLDDMARNVESEPAMKAAVREAGLSPREFALIGMSFMQTSMAAGIAKMRPTDNQDSLIREMKANPANVKFLLDNEAELTRKHEALQAEIKRMGGADDGS